MQTEFSVVAPAAMDEDIVAFGIGAAGILVFALMALFMMTMLCTMGVVAFRLWLDSMDRQRILDHLAARGCMPQDISWRWLLLSGERNERHYKVVYLTRDGHAHTGLCKTSMLSGVWWKENPPP